MLIKGLIYKIAETKLPTKLNLNYINKFNSSISDKNKIFLSNFMISELKVRLAHKVIELNNLPYGLNDSPFIEKVSNLYVKSFEKINKIKEVNDLNTAHKLVNQLCLIKEGHKFLEYDISRAILNLIETNNNEYDFNIDNFLDKFYNSRIGIRIIISQYLSVFKKELSIIDENCNPNKIINEAIEEVKFLANMNNINVPKIKIYISEDFTFTYIYSHIYYIILEILKNSIVGIHNNSKITNDIIKDVDKNTINIFISKGQDDLIIKISDFGGGFARDKMHKIYSYGYTTSKADFNKNNNNYIISGYGHGIPLSRLYCRYFGGELKIIPFERIGTDVLIYINRLGNSEENIL